MAVGLRRAGLEYVHFEAGQVGATMAWWAAGTRWFSGNERIGIAGVPLGTAFQEKATREEYLAYLRGIVEQFDLEIRTYTRVTAIRGLGMAGGRAGGYLLTVRHALHETAPEETVAVDKIILATGGTAGPNMLGVPGEDLPHVSHYFRDPHAYFRQRLLVVGGRNSAVEAALRCHRLGARVHLSYRGAALDAKAIKYWLYPEFSSLVKSGKIAAHFNTVVHSIAPDHVVLAPAQQTTGSPPTATAPGSPLRLPDRLRAADDRLPGGHVLGPDGRRGTAGRPAPARVQPRYDGDQRAEGIYGRHPRSRARSSTIASS